MAVSIAIRGQPISVDRLVGWSIRRINYMTDLDQREEVQVERRFGGGVTQERAEFV